MIVKDLMRRDVRCVRLGDRLDAAARAMWEQDCGVVPVVDGNGAVVGMLTDRDVAMAAFTQGKALGDVPVTTAMARAVRTARPDDRVAAALATMASLQVRRLPVVDARGVVVGIVTANDCLRLAAAAPAALAPEAVVRALAAIGAPRRGGESAPAAPVAPAAPAAAAAAAGPAPVTIAAPVAIPAPRAGKSGGAKARPGGKGHKGKGRKD